MKPTVRSLPSASLLALAGLLGLGVGSAHAQAVYYPQPSTAYAYPRYYQGGTYYQYPAYARSYSYAPRAATRPATRPAAPNPGIGGHGYHYGYFPARRELPLYKPWLRRD